MKKALIIAAMALLCLGVMARADVFDMGTGLTSLEMVTVGNPGNAADTATNFGAVGRGYSIGKYEVTAAQYTEFLNAVARTDSRSLYNISMWNSTYGCKIKRSGYSGSYTYSVAGDYANSPVNFASFWDACRFANWLHNGQPTGPQNLGTTEDGAYFLNGVTNPENAGISRKPTAEWAVPTEDEWYKAAFYNPSTGGYFAYPTSSNGAPGRDMSESTNPGNNCNYWPGSGAWPIDSGTYYLTVAGEFQLSRSPYGTFDQAGGISEWTEAIIASAYRGRRGGCFCRGTEEIQASYQGHDYPDYEGYDKGFRVTAYALGTSTLRGHVNLQDFNLNSCAVAVTIDLIRNGSLVRTENVILDSNSNYSIPNVAPGTYEVRFKASSWLPEKSPAPVVIPPDGIVDCNIALTNGDADGDDELTSTDLSVVLHASAAGDNRPVFFRSGVSTPKIVISSNADPCETFAAQEMAAYLGKITGSVIEIVNDGSTPPGVVIAIGKNTLTSSIDVTGLDTEQYVIDIQPNLVSIVGGRGTLYGVYEFLEDLGVRWYRPEPWGEHVPKRSLITLDMGRKVSPKPVHEMRSVLAGGFTRWRETTPQLDDWRELWVVRNRLNFDASALPEHGGRAAFRFWECYNTFVPPSEYFSPHPEYYSLINGVRTVTSSSGWKLCLGNTNLQNLFAQKVIQFARDYPDSLSIPAEPSDGWGWCECSLCRAMDDPNDPPDLRDPRNSSFNASNRLSKFNNIIAQRLAQEVPGARLHWLAYNQYMRVPSIVSRLEPNAIIQPTSMTFVYAGLAWNDYSKRLMDPSSAANAAFVNLLSGWNSLGPSAVFTYEYWSGYAWPGPLPLTRMVAERLKNYPQLGVHGIYNETEPCWGPQGIDLYMTAKLMWNPNLDVNRELDLYYMNYYGPAEKPMKAFHTALMDAFESAPQPVYSGGQGTHLIFTPGLIVELGKYMAEAQSLVTGKPLYAKRLYGVWAGYEVARRVSEILEIKKARGALVSLPEGGSYLRSDEAETKLRELEVWMRSVNSQDAIFDMKINFQPSGDDRDIGAIFGYYWRDQILRNAVFPSMREEILLRNF